MTTIKFYDPDWLKRWVKSKGWKNMTVFERHIAKKACTSKAMLEELKTLKSDRPWWKFRFN